ncbi:MAG: hypothetical protein P4L92_19270 [Rudaea sp.]|nr:hypothetical protein [Rudaea sp.]
MSLLDFFRSGKAVGFAKTVVGEYCQVNALVDSGKKHAGRKPERMIAIIRRISAFARAERLNFYVRARMLAAIKSGLKEAGIPADEVEEFIRAVTLEELRPHR